MTEEILILGLQPLSSEIFVISIGRNNAITAGLVIWHEKRECENVNLEMQLMNSLIKWCSLQFNEDD